LRRRGDCIEKTLLAHRKPLDSLDGFINFIHAAPSDNTDNLKTRGDPSARFNEGLGVAVLIFVSPDVIDSNTCCCSGFAECEDLTDLISGLDPSEFKNLIWRPPILRSKEERFDPGLARMIHFLRNL
jgi:hypothetical protein